MKSTTRRTSTITSTLAIATLSLALVACASDSSSDSAGSTTPPTTAPPTTVQPPGTDAPAPDSELPAKPIDIDEGSFDTIKSLGDSADLIVVGTVTDEQSLGRPQATNDPSSDEYLGLTISIDSVLEGEPLDQVTLGWDAYATDADGNRIATNVMNGIPVPHVGDQLVLFLRPVDSQFASLLDGFPTHTPVALDGIGYLEDGTITISDNTADTAAHLTGMTVEQVAAAL